LEIARGGHHELRRAPLGSLAAGLHILPRALSKDHLAPNGTKYTTRHARGYRKEVRVSRKSPATATRIRLEMEGVDRRLGRGQGQHHETIRPV